MLVGWCGYYFIQMCGSTLPSSVESSQEIWNSLQVCRPHLSLAPPLPPPLQDSNWPVLCHAIAIVLASLAVSRGVSTIEPVNKVSLSFSPSVILTILHSR